MTRRWQPAVGVVVAAIVAAGAVALVGPGCERRRHPAPEPVGSGVPFPEITTIDWHNLTYDLGSLGTVKATAGRATFQIVEDELGVPRASQVAGVASELSGALELQTPIYVDVDGDAHDEVVIPFVLDSTSGDTPRVFGGFVFALRDGVVIRLATIPTTKPGFTIDGATIRTGDGDAWGWDAGRSQLVAQPSRR